MGASPAGTLASSANATDVVLNARSGPCTGAETSVKLPWALLQNSIRATSGRQSVSNSRSSVAERRLDKAEVDGSLPSAGAHLF